MKLNRHSGWIDAEIKLMEQPLNSISYLEFLSNGILRITVTSLVKYGANSVGIGLSGKAYLSDRGEVFRMINLLKEKVAGSKFADLLTVIKLSQRWGYLYLGIVKHPGRSPMLKLNEEKGMTDIVSDFEIDGKKVSAGVLSEAIIFDFLKEKPTKQSKKNKRR